MSKFVALKPETYYLTLGRQLQTHLKQMAMKQFIIFILSFISTCSPAFSRAIQTQDYGIVGYRLQVIMTLKNSEKRLLLASWQKNCWTNYNIPIPFIWIFTTITMRS